MTASLGTSPLLLLSLPFFSFLLVLSRLYAALSLHAGPPGDVKEDTRAQEAPLPPSLPPSRLLVFANNLWNSSVRCFFTPTPRILLLLHEKA